MFPHGFMPRESPERSRQGSFGPEGRSTVGKYAPMVSRPGPLSVPSLRWLFGAGISGSPPQWWAMHGGHVHVVGGCTPVFRH